MWSRVTASAQWSSRYGSAIAWLANGNLLLNGGSGGTYNDVWRSSNGGLNWNQSLAAGPMGPIGDAAGACQSLQFQLGIYTSTHPHLG